MTDSAQRRLCRFHFGVEKMKKTKFFKDLAVVTLSTALIGAATCCYVRAGLGGDSVAVFLEGLSVAFGISLGTASWSLNIVLVALAFLMARKHIGWTTVYSCILTGSFIDLADALLDPVFSLSGALWYRWGIFLAGLLLLTVACALMIRFCPGMSIMDAIVTRLSERTGISFRTIRILIDTIMMFSGWLMGGMVGIGTVAAVLCTGPLIQWFSHFGKKS
jgi:uncharacterized membrane protein YczE